MDSEMARFREEAAQDRGRNWRDTRSKEGKRVPMHYPWTLWMDGHRHVIEQGKRPWRPSKSSEDMYNTLYMHARLKGVTVLIYTEGFRQCFQFFKRGHSPEREEWLPYAQHDLQTTVVEDHITMYQQRTEE